MSKINHKELTALYKASDINTVWQKGQNLKVINHPRYGLITPNSYRAMNAEKPCPFCGQKMKHGAEFHTNRKSKAILLGYEYFNEDGKKIINRAGNHISGYTYFHPHYVTLDHKLNKARFPERMFDFDNLQAMCWKCNNAKGDNNAFELEHTRSYIRDLVRETLNRYPTL